ncbi:MAG: hypothetical protein O3C63_01870 [Cyanobacteria bacterium]|nr:hypothetical protein [Cyanobacteriota bacterium]MDA1021637.1 hypothetical protein [Cyanobacteriota bacterium]
MISIVPSAAKQKERPKATAANEPVSNLVYGNPPVKQKVIITTAERTTPPKFNETSSERPVTQKPRLFIQEYREAKAEAEAQQRREELESLARFANSITRKPREDHKDTRPSFERANG